ncbi:urease accessory protein UreD [Nocardia thailandica]|uniref:urease accessory protein UreD n=1 Tax=Nocardia thailandica TaxID=257275 RepID=UPI0002E43E13|nr:urease accessory protein UreD [Nocardia thailandica]
MRTELRLDAAPGRLTRIEAVGGLAARHTGPETVHLIGTAATPLGGDELDITVVVRPGARLTVRSVAATLALPGRHALLSTARWTVEVGENATLDFDPEPIVVAGGAAHHAVTVVRLAPGATLRLRERVQIGRTGEDEGTWRGDLVADLADLPLLRHRLALGARTATDDTLTAPRALDSELRYPDDRPARTDGLATARLPLAAGGSLTTTLTARLAAAPSGPALSADDAADRPRLSAPASR